MPRYAVHVPGPPPLTAVIQHLRRMGQIGWLLQQPMCIKLHVVPRGIHRGQQSVPCRCWLLAGRSLERSWRCGPSIRPANGAACARNGQDHRSSRSNRLICRCVGQSRGQTAANVVWKQIII